MVFMSGQAGDEDQLALCERFDAEGLDVQVLTDSQKLSHVWQWLVDAESNCLSLRRQIDKLHRQHEQDLKACDFCNFLLGFPAKKLDYCYF